MTKHAVGRRATLEFLCASRRMPAIDNNICIRRTILVLVRAIVIEMNIKICLLSNFIILSYDVCQILHI